MEKIEKFLIGWTIPIVSYYMLVYISDLDEGFFCSLCGYIGRIIQFQSSIIDLLLMHFKVDWIICILGLLFFIIKLIRND